MVRPLKAARAASRNPDSLSVSVCIATCTSYCSATDRHVSMVAGVVPQSSCSFRPQAPPSICCTSPGGSEALPLPRNPKLSGHSSAACSIIRMWKAPGVHVVALVPVAGPVPPPSMVVIPEAMASPTCCGQMKCTCASKAPAVRICPSPATTSVVTPTTIPGLTPGMMSGLPALPMPAILPSLMPISAL